MRKILSLLALVVLSVYLVSCSSEKKYTLDEWEAMQAESTSSSTVNNSEFKYTVPDELTGTYGTYSTERIEPKTTAESSASKLKTDTQAYTKPTSIATKPNINTTVTKAPTTASKAPTVAQPTKPKVTDEIIEQVSQMIVQSHYDEIQDIENRHIANMESINKEAEDFEVTYLIELRRINEQYANMGLANSGAHKAAIQNLDNRRNAISQKRDNEINRYEEEKSALNERMVAEMMIYLEQNYDMN